MAAIQKYVAQQALDPDAGGMPRPQVSNAVGQALQGFGGAIANLGEALDARREQKEDFKAENAYRRLQLNLGRQLDDRAQDMAVDGEGFHDDFLQNVYMPERQKFLDSVPERLREKYQTILGDEGVDTESWSIKAATRERDQTYKWYSDQLSESRDQLATAIAMDPDGYDAFLQQGLDEIEASGLPTAEKEEQRRTWERMAQVSYLNRMLETNPEQVLKELHADPRMLSPTSQFGMLKAAVIGVESEGDAAAVSPKGAIGLMQVMPGTARDIAKEIGDKNFDPRWDPEQVSRYISNPAVNQRYGEYYLKKQIKDFSARGGLEAALIAYNGGPERAKKWIESGFDDSVLPKETRDYYKKVLRRAPGVRAEGKGDPRKVELVFRDRSADLKNSKLGESGVNPELVDRVKASFAAIGIDRVRINSGHRSEKDNKRVKGVKQSQHLTGNAMDIDVSGYSHAERVRIIATLSANGITGIGVGNNIIHADLGSRRAWGYGDEPGVPKWAKEVIGEHLAGSARAAPGGVGLSGRYATLSYADRQSFIGKADQEMTRRSSETSKKMVVERMQLKTAMSNELATLQATGQTSGSVDDTAISTLLGEDDYVRWVADRQQALRIFNATDGVETMTFEEMGQRLKDYEPTPGSTTFADDTEVQAAVRKEVERVTKLRSTQPDKAALEYPDLSAAYEQLTASSDPTPADVQNFVQLMLERQREFNLKPGSEAPVPREWGLEIGRSLARVPEMSGKNIADVNASITLQYLELQKVFGPYTEEVILYALREYAGVGQNTAEVIKGYMEAIEAGGDPLKLNRNAAADRDQVESVAEPGIWQKVKNFWAGEELDAEPDDPGPVEPEEPSVEAIRRATEQLKSLDEVLPEDEAALVVRYGQAAVDAAKARLGKD